MEIYVSPYPPPLVAQAVEALANSKDLIEDVGEKLIKPAFEKLDDVFAAKKDYTLQRPMMTNADLARLINSDEVQSVVRPTISKAKPAPLRKNPLKNRDALMKVNPYLAQEREKVTKQSQANAVKRAAHIKSLREGKPGKGPGKGVKKVGRDFYSSMIVDSDYSHQWNTPFKSWLEQE